MRNAYFGRMQCTVDMTGGGRCFCCSKDIFSIAEMSWIGSQLCPAWSWGSTAGTCCLPKLRAAGVLIASFCLFKTMYFSGVFLKFLMETFSKTHHFSYSLAPTLQHLPRPLELLYSWEDFFQKEVFSPCLQVSVLILKLQLADET